MSIKAAVEEFTQRLRAILEANALERARASVLAAFGLGGPKRRGRPPKALASAAPETHKKTRKKPPRQLCPVPYCRNTAAPVFGMVCAKHKDVPKAKIKAYRAARKLKSGGAQAAPKARAKAASKKKASPRRPRRMSKLASKPVSKKASKPAPRKMSRKARRKVSTKVSAKVGAEPAVVVAPPPPSGVAATPTVN